MAPLNVNYTANRRYSHSQPDLFTLSAVMRNLLYVDHDFLAAPNVALRNSSPVHQQSAYVCVSAPFLIADTG